LAYGAIIGWLVVAGGDAAHAVTIAYVGSVEGSEVADWRTNSATKSFDVDGDNVYGTHAALHPRIGSTNIYTSGSQEPGFTWLGYGPVNGGQFINAAYTDVDNLLDPSVNTDAGIQTRGFRFELTGTSDTYDNMRVRIGVMQDLLSPAEYATDSQKTLRLEGYNNNPEVSSGDITIRNGNAGDGVAEMYFFDITGASAGDQFQFIDMQNGVSTGGSYIGPVSFDIVVVPEPSGVLLCGLVVAAGLITRRRRSPA